MPLYDVASWRWRATIELAKAIERELSRERVDILKMTDPQLKT